MYALGMNGWAAVASSDPVDQLLQRAIAKQLAEYRKFERRELAAEIINALGRAMK